MKTAFQLLAIALLGPSVSISASESDVRGVRPPPSISFISPASIEWDPRGAVTVEVSPTRFDLSLLCIGGDVQFSNDRNASDAHKYLKLPYLFPEQSSAYCLERSDKTVVEFQWISARSPILSGGVSVVRVWTQALSKVADPVAVASTFVWVPSRRASIAVAALTRLGGSGGGVAPWWDKGTSRYLARAYALGAAEAEAAAESEMAAEALAASPAVPWDDEGWCPLPANTVSHVRSNVVPWNSRRLRNSKLPLCHESGTPDHFSLYLNIKAA